jgi:alkylglycerol monooxygenase
VWDRLFGTFAEETEKPIYGITSPLASYNPLWAQVHYWVELLRRTPREGLSLWWRAPSHGAHKGADAGAVEPRGRSDPRTPPGVKMYVVVQLALLTAGTFVLLLHSAELSLRLLGLASAAVLLGTLAFGALLEGRRWALPAEVGRLALTLALFGAWTSGALH